MEANERRRSKRSMIEAAFRMTSGRDSTLQKSKLHFSRLSAMQIGADASGAVREGIQGRYFVLSQVAVARKVS